MFTYIECKTIQSGSSELRATIEAKHVVPDVLPPPPDKASIKPADNLKDPDKIAESIEKRFAKALADHEETKAKLESKRAAAAAAAEQEWRDLRKSADTARICAISVAIDDGAVRRIEVGVQTASGDGPDFVYGVQTDEVKALRDLFAECGRGDSGCAPTIVTHFAPTVIGMIRKRALILGVAVPNWWPWHLQHSGERIHDIQFMWDGGFSRPGLDRMAKTFGLPGRTDAIANDGRVWDRIAAGGYADVGDYCDDELLRVRCIHRRMLGLKPLAIDMAFLTRDWSGVSEKDVVAAGYQFSQQEGAAA